MSRVVTLKIDERDVSGREDESVLHVARENGIFIPTLCHIEGLSMHGGCRLCLVHVKGINRLLPACAVKVAEGMEVTTNSETLANYRRTIIEMLFVEGNHICAVCVSNGHCELQDMAQTLEVDHINLTYRYPRREVDASHERFILDQNRCILCTRCVRVCDEVEGAHTWDVMARGIDSRVITDLNQPWGDSETCTTCGKCVNVCPTGALFEKGKSVSEMLKHREFLPYLTAMREKQK
jgi:bidirectional [NiFe] hydrogenase diaphorase subunit